MKYEVQHNTVCDGWINCWTVSQGDGPAVPQTFDTEKEAQTELDGFFEDIAYEIAEGTREPDEGYDREDFRIVPVEDKG